MITKNSYFNDKVQSLGFESEFGKVTIGVILPGDYSFGTSTKEEMRVTSGVLEVCLPEEKEFHPYTAGEKFFVESGKTFNVKCKKPVSYVCIYS